MNPLEQLRQRSSALQSIAGRTLASSRVPGFSRSSRDDIVRFASSTYNAVRRHFASWKGLALLLLLGCCLLALTRSGGFAGTGSPEADDYILGPQDKVRIRVFEWRASRDEVFEWAALNAEYTVGAGGKLSLPLLGEIRAGGKSPSELSSAIGSALKRRIGLAEPPDISVEVVQFRPFYISGDVERPGEYAYRPGLTVLQGITIAGGTTRQAGRGLRLEREAISADGDISLLLADLAGVVARKARLTAELQGLEEIPIPQDLKPPVNPTTVKEMVVQESFLFQSRKAAFAAEVQALEQLRSLHEKEASSLTEQLSTHSRQIGLVNRELETVVELYNKQLTTAPRKLALERNAAQLEGDRIRLEANLNRAHQEVARTDIAMLDLRNKRLNQITTEIRANQTREEELGQRIETATKLLYDTEFASSRLAATRAGLERARPIYTVVRRSSDNWIEIVVSETTRLEPGDTLKVELSTPSSAPMEATTKSPKFPTNLAPQSEATREATRATSTRQPLN